MSMSSAAYLRPTQPRHVDYEGLFAALDITGSVWDATADAVASYTYEGGYRKEFDYSDSPYRVIEERYYCALTLLAKVEYIYEGVTDQVVTKTWTRYVQ